MTIYDELKARGLIAQVTDEEEIKELINNGKATFYIGFDCTADSLTAGHFMALTLMKRLQLAGNKPIALLGGGTTMIGDPSGRTDMRKIDVYKRQPLRRAGARICRGARWRKQNDPQGLAGAAGRKTAGAPIRRGTFVHGRRVPAGRLNDSVPKGCYIWPEQKRQWILNLRSKSWKRYCSVFRRTMCLWMRVFRCMQRHRS